jgi:MFS family permease
VVVAYSLGSILSTIPTGFLVDRFGRRPILFLGPVLTATSSFLVATARSFPELLGYQFIGGWAQEMWKQSRLP